MKIVSWNLRNVSLNKLYNTFSATFNAYGLGNDVGDYMNRFVMGEAPWTSIPGMSANPADVFIMIELKTGGRNKGLPVSGNCLPTLNAVVADLNVRAVARYGVNPPYVYNYVTPQITGRNETVGIIYNTQSLTLVAGNAVRRLNNTWINPRTPFGAQFTVIADGSVFQVVGIHAPPPSGGAAVRYRPPIDYSNQLQFIQPATVANSFFMGDFNCNPASVYTNGFGVAVPPFQNMIGVGFLYGTHIANGTLSSVRNKLANANLPPANYLNDAYDNIVFNAPLPAATTHEIVADTIGNARDMRNAPPTLIPAANLLGVFNAYNRVSDHLPVVIEF